MAARRTQLPPPVATARPLAATAAPDQLPTLQPPPSPHMKHKHSAATLRALALDGTIAACEARAFAAFHAGTLDAATHVDYVEAFVLQLGAPAQHPATLALLGHVERGFRAGKIAYKPPGCSPPWRAGWARGSTATWLMPRCARSAPLWPRCARRFPFCWKRSPPSSGARASARPSPP